MQTTLVLLMVLTAAGDGMTTGSRADHLTAVRLPAGVTETDATTIPHLVSFQGRLADTLGIPVPDTLHAVRFRLYARASGGVHFWEETQSVLTGDGLFAVLLGSVTPISDVPEAGNLYLGMKVGSDAEMTPRIRVASVAYSFRSARARHADTAQYAVTGPGGGDNAWTRGTPDSVLFTVKQLGIARGGASNMLHGSSRHSHVNLGVACTTGTSGQDHAGCTVGGGRFNTASSNYSTVGGGGGNSASDSYATVAGGSGNTATASHATVGGGRVSIASGTNATVSGGKYNTASGYCAAVGGGVDNNASDYFATVGGGSGNMAAGNSTVGGGGSNTASGLYATVGGGFLSTASGDSATVAGGGRNVASGDCATVGGGNGNAASGINATVGGGYENRAPGNRTVVGGGYRNNATGEYSTIPGGYADTCAGDYSVVMGDRVRTSSSADLTFACGEDFVTDAERAVVFYHSGGTTKLGIGVTDPTHNIDVAGGAYCTGAYWINGSDRESTSDVTALSDRELQAVLDQLDRTDVVRYRLTSEDSGEEHIGLLVGDAPEAIATPTRDGINTSDAIGWLVAIAKAQQAEIEELRTALEDR